MRSHVPQCGCALVAVRKVDPSKSADARKARAYEARFPSFNFVDGLETVAPQLAAQSAALAKGGLGADWQRTLYYEPRMSIACASSLGAQRTSPPSCCP